MRERSQGFTLVELVMVLFIITLVLGGILVPLSAKLEQDERKKADQLLQEAKTSLLGYAVVNGHLPCPDCPDASGGCSSVGTTGDAELNDGLEDLTVGVLPTSIRSDGATCAAEIGNLPWATLGISEFDPWGNHFTYRVTGSFADSVDEDCASGAAGVSFHICSDADINIEDGSGGAVASGVPAVVITFGKNANEPGNPSSASETENQAGDEKLFISKDYTSGETDEFDDMLVWIPLNVLIYRMIQAERLP